MQHNQLLKSARAAEPTTKTRPPASLRTLICLLVLALATWLGQSHLCADEYSRQQQDSNLPAYEPIQPINTEIGGKFTLRRQPDGSYVGTFTDGIYVSHRDAAQDVFLELRARNAVVFSESFEKVTGVYLEGDVVLDADKYGPARNYQITAQRLYYDLVHNQALVLDGALRLQLIEPEIPISVRARRMRQFSLEHFEAQGVKLSNDEFYQPHVWLGAEAADIRLAGATAEEFSYRLDGVTANLGDVPVFYWPKAAGTWRNIDAPIKNVHLSYESDRGMSFQSEWYLAWLLGLREPNGVDATLHLDEFSKRGPAGGIDADYTSEDYFGHLRTYVLADEGQDRLGKYPSRRDIEPTESLRGRARWQHRQFLPLDWQGTFEVSYQSDPDFLESWYEKEFDTDKEQETLVYFKQQRDNWAVDFLSKWQLNDFEYTLEELPTFGAHLAGQDLFNTFTYYHDGHVSRLRERSGDRDVPGFSGIYEPSVLPGMLDEQPFAFAVSRHELTWPLRFDALNVTPVAIGTYVYDDSLGDQSLLQGAIGVRSSMQFWRLDNAAKSRLWDIDRLRHVVTPEVSAFWIDADRGDVDHSNVVNFTLRQRWQTLRGPAQQKHSVDVLRWDCALTLTDRDVDDADLPGRFLFTRPERQLDYTPFVNPDLANLGLARREQINQTVSDHLTTDLTWQVSDTTTVTGSLNYNLHDGVINHADVALAVQRSPRLSYFLGDRYSRNGDPFADGDQLEPFDSHVLTAGGTYRLNRKYTIALAHQYDIERTSGSYSQAAIVRKFSHWYGAVSVGYDSANDSVSLQVGFWPEGFDKIAIGTRRFARLTR